MADMSETYDQNDLEVQHALGRIESSLKSLVEHVKAQNDRVAMLEIQQAETVKRLDVFFGKLGVVFIGLAFAINFAVDWIVGMFTNRR